MSRKIRAPTDLNNLIFRFECDFPDEYRSLRALLERTQGSARLADDKDFRCDLGDIVYNYGKERTRKEHRDSAEQFADDIKDVIGNLSAASGTLGELDGLYKTRIAEFMKANPFFDEPNYNLGHVFRDLEKAKLVLSFLSLALGYAYYFDAKPQGRSRPSLPYYVQTVRLMDVWERYTGTKVVAPKGVASGKRKSEEATQPSTEFVRLGLKMIDPSVSAANTMTMIKRVLTDRKKNEGKPLSALIAPPELQDTIKAWKKLKKQSEGN